MFIKYLDIQSLPACRKIERGALLLAKLNKTFVIKIDSNQDLA